VREKKADAVVSAGHSGATMSLATLRIGRLKGVMRPAIATVMPTKTGGRTLVLDVGANVDSEAEHLFQFAIMGKAYAVDFLEIERPRVGLLANGEEPSKGNRVVKEAHEILKNTPDFNFIGNVEGNDIFSGDVDVVVCDGFVGNVLLKTGEGVASSVSFLLKKFIKESFVSIIGALLSKSAFAKLKKELDYAEYGGAPLIGVNGCAIVSHGKSNEKAIKNAILQALKFVESGVNEDILEYLEKYGREKK
jgi:glycerol-3-phosphate acyltransferase PlsX